MDLSKNNFILAKSLLDLAKNIDERKCYLTFLLYTIYCVLISVSLSLFSFAVTIFQLNTMVLINNDVTLKCSREYSTCFLLQMFFYLNKTNFYLPNLT